MCSADDETRLAPSVKDHPVSPLSNEGFVKAFCWQQLAVVEMEALSR